MKRFVGVVILSGLWFALSLLFPRSALGKSYSITGSSTGGCSNNGTFLPATLNVDVGEAVSVEITISDPAYPSGWVIKGFPEGDVTISNNSSHMFNFTAAKNFTFSGWWPTPPDTCHKADGVVNITQPTPTPVLATPVPTPEPTPSPSPAPTDSPEPTYPSSTPKAAVTVESHPVKPNNTGRNLLIGAIGLVSTAALGVGAWLLLKRPKIKK